MNTKNGGFSFVQVLSTINCFDPKLQRLEFEQHQPKSAVSIIIKQSKSYKWQLNENEQASNLSDFIHDQILLLQRKKSAKDRFSGQICFPGGQQQRNETLLNCAIRQTFEQTNILLSEKNLIGCIDRQVNFIISTKKYKIEEGSQKILNDQKNTRQMVVYAFVFRMSQDEVNNSEIKLNLDQISTFKWVKMNRFLNPVNVCWLDYTGRIKSLVHVYRQNPMIQWGSYDLMKTISHALSPAFDVQMSEKLYGITLYMLMILLFNFNNKLSQQLKNNYEKYSNKKISLIMQIQYNFCEIKNRCKEYFHLVIKQPIDENFRKFQNALFADMYTMRPRL